jgi:hypothetical protein
MPFIRLNSLPGGAFAVIERFIKFLLVLYGCFNLHISSYLILKVFDALITE